MDFHSIIRNWRKWIGFVVIVTYCVLLVIAIPLCIWELDRKGAPDHVQAWFIGGFFVMMALPISFWGILQHVINYTTPHLQRYIIRILWMVPIYAINAWFALRFPAAAIYLDTLRECYEAYVVYNFMAYLLSFLHTEYPHLEIQVENKPPVTHVFPLCLLPPCHNGRKFIQRCKHGVLQYTVVRPTMTIIAVICETVDKYGEGDFNFTTAWTYIVFINNFSQIVAMYCLVLFYKAFREELHPLKPVPKFLCVKAVVFMSFWQAVLIAALAKLGAIPTNGTWVFYKNIKEVATGLQDFLICIEMLLAAIAHYYSFSHKPFVNLAAEQQNCCQSFLSMWDVRDITDDVAEHARYIGRGMHKTLSRGKKLQTENESERTPLLSGAGASEATSQDRYARSTSVQNLQNKKPPSPAVHLDDGLSSDGESLTGRRFDSFVNKSTTSSMNNYAEFSVSVNTTEEGMKGMSRSISLRAYDSEEEEYDDKNDNSASGLESEQQASNFVGEDSTKISAPEEDQAKPAVASDLEQVEIKRKDYLEEYEHLDVDENLEEVDEAINPSCSVDDSQEKGNYDGSVGEAKRHDKSDLRSSNVSEVETDRDENPIV